jgi:RNA polymerase sigma factor (sigma-70 family)
MNMGNNFLAAGQDATSPEAVDSTSDVAAIARVRAGDPTAFEVLYLRHHDSARALARRQVDNPADTDDVVAEAFTSILNSLVEGKGPDTFFRAYLFTTVRRTAYKRNTANARVRMTDEDSVLETVIFDKDTVVAEFESTAMSTAFFSLPERWQLVLWHVDIEEMKPAAVAPILGLSANGISSLAIRAREGLRRAYLQNHVAAAAGGCAEFAGSLGAFARNGLKRSTQESVQEHLLGCSGCTAALLEVNDVQAGMRAHVFPLVAGLGFSSAFTAAAGGSGALLGSNAQPGVGVAARKSVLGSPKVLVGAALAVALMVLVALTGWLNRPAPEASVVGAPMPTAQTSPAATLAPSPSASPSASSSSASPAPQSTTPAPPVESAPAPTAEAPVGPRRRPPSGPPLCPCQRCWCRPPRPRPRPRRYRRYKPCRRS